MIDVPNELDFILKKWIKINKFNYMLYSTNGNKLTIPQVTRILNKVFDKNVSSSMLRHIYLTNKYKDIPALSKMQNIAMKWVIRFLRQWNILRDNISLGRILSVFLLHR
jgi:hypothetical protein